MNDITATTSTAPNSPTPPGALTSPAATPAPAAPRPGVIADRVYDSLPDEQKAGYARVRKGPQGGSEWIERAKLAAEPADPTKGAEGTATVTPDGRLQLGDMLLSQSDIQSLIAEKAQADLRKAQMPTAPEAYEAKLPEGMQLPAGVEFSFNTEDPAYAAVRNWAHAQEFTQAQFSELLGHYANSEAAKQVMIGNAAKAEVEKLGAMGTARVTAVDQWLRGTLGDDLGTAVRGMMVTARIVQGLEKLMTKMATQGHASFRQDGREPQSNSKGPLSSMSEEQYNATSAQERFRLSRLGQ